MEKREERVPVVRCAACRIAKCGNTKSPCYGRLVYLTEFCSHGEREEDT